MEYEHLFAESDIEEAETQPRPEPFTGQRRLHSRARWEPCYMNRTFLPNRPRREPIPVPFQNPREIFEKYRRKHFLLIERSNAERMMINNHIMDSLGGAGPSRRSGPSDGPVDYRYDNIATNPYCLFSHPQISSSFCDGCFRVFFFQLKNVASQIVAAY